MVVQRLIPETGFTHIDIIFRELEAYLMRAFYHHPEEIAGVLIKPYKLYSIPGLKIIVESCINNKDAANKFDLSLQEFLRTTKNNRKLKNIRTPGDYFQLIKEIDPDDMLSYYRFIEHVGGSIRRARGWKSIRDAVKMHHAAYFVHHYGRAAVHHTIPLNRYFIRLQKSLNNLDPVEEHNLRDTINLLYNLSTNVKYHNAVWGKEALYRLAYILMDLSENDFNALAKQLDCKNISKKAKSDYFAALRLLWSGTNLAYQETKSKQIRGVDRLIRAHYFAHLAFEAYNLLPGTTFIRENKQMTRIDELRDALTEAEKLSKALADAPGLNLAVPDINPKDISGQPSEKEKRKEGVTILAGISLYHAKREYTLCNLNQEIHELDGTIAKMLTEVKGYGWRTKLINVIGKENALKFLGDLKLMRKTGPVRSF